MRSLLPVVVALTLGGCSGAIWGNLSVLLITCGIFFGTLSLGRRLQPPTSPAPSASADDAGSKM